MKPHHPHNRAERLKTEKEHSLKPKTKRNSVAKKLLQQTIAEKEAEDALRAAVREPSVSTIDA